MSFQKGKKGEDFAKKVLEGFDILCEKNEDYDKRYDYDLVCEMNGRRFTIEVKFDDKSSSTGNLYIEYHNSKADKPSGVTVTKSDLWIQVLPEESGLKTVWVTSVKSLRDFMEKVEPYKRIAFGGDKNSAGYVYTKEAILNNLFLRIDNLDKKSVLKLIKEMLDDTKS
jgi:hypothetical protein